MEIIKNKEEIENCEHEFHSYIKKELKTTKLLKFKNNAGNEILYPVKVSKYLNLWYNYKFKNNTREFEFGNLEKYTIYNPNINVNNAIKTYLNLKFNYNNIENSEYYFAKDKNNNHYLIIKLKIESKIYKILKQEKLPINKENNNYIFKFKLDETVKILNKFVETLLKIENNTIKLKTKSKTKNKVIKEEDFEYEQKEKETMEYLNKKDKLKTIEFEIKKGEIISYRIIF